MIVLAVFIFALFIVGCVVVQERSYKTWVWRTGKLGNYIRCEFYGTKEEALKLGMPNNFSKQKENTST